ARAVGLGDQGGEAAHDRHRYLPRLALDQVAGGGDLVGHGGDRDLERVAERVRLATVVAQRHHPRPPHRAARLPHPPRPPPPDGLPTGSVTTTPPVPPSRARSALRSRRADSSGSSGSSTTVPGAVLDASTPAAASTKPCRVCAMVVGPRLATTRTVSDAIASSRDADTTRPSALLTTLEVTTTMSPWRRPGPVSASAAPAISAPRSSPGDISGIPGMPEMCSWGKPGPGSAGPGSVIG